MLFSKLALAVLPAVALAAPTPGEGDNYQVTDFSAVDPVQAASIASLWQVVEDGSVVIGPGGWMKDGQFHEGEYKPSKRDGDATHEHEERLFGLTLALLGGGLRKILGGLGGGAAGGGTTNPPTGGGGASGSGYPPPWYFQGGGFYGPGGQYWGAGGYCQSCGGQGIW